jgi:hypothetical protein
MAMEFYSDIGNQIGDYQKRIENLLQCGSDSTKILDRWLLKIDSLEQKKLDYEAILQQRLNGMDEEFEVLKSLCGEYKLRVNRKGTGVKFAA